MPELTSHIARKRSTRTLAATLAVGTASVFALSACSSSGSAATGGTGAKTPIQALDASVTNLSNNNSESFEVSLQPDAAMIAAMNKSSSSSDAAITSKLFGNGGIDIKVSVSADKPLKELSSTDTPNTDFTFELGGKNYLEFRLVAGALYAKADVPDALSLAGMPSSVVTGELGKLPADVQAPANAVLGGNWIEISAADLKSLTAMASSLGGSDLSPAAGVTPNSAQAAQILASLVSALTKDSTVVDKGNGHLQVTGSMRTLAQNLIQAYEPLLSSIPGAQAKNSLDKVKTQLSQIPAQNITFDAYVSGGQLNEIKVDLAQFAAAQAGGGHLPLDVKLSSSAPSVTAPSGATVLNVKQLISDFTSGL